ncbi:hypothetical protein METBIDRAFT_11520 [Metschnikowia bicuspidata var. bicuspidata NRRL YB-4993]|uniref:Uncharacterized protein n=1 Tax=Metschnikowia bicuspidata var. bicuspidata NRRL YB-4993 TaxID=869754 RepID=A0A1A0H9V8_9ASCO|nr:hypothetical protein METBIDRAFT_11520 [Metschnikowia bicuspidata var. bicuspidata NRRL YB-4993]OBA20914.1 hypothetical protein METBIDRAFT_11520 [Metschnikowia bicuspidata var. bicuspidata NRRL YB-4993]
MKSCKSLKKYPRPSNVEEESTTTMSSTEEYMKIWNTLTHDNSDTNVYDTQPDIHGHPTCLQDRALLTPRNHSGCGWSVRKEKCSWAKIRSRMEQVLVGETVVLCAVCLYGHTPGVLGNG